MEYKIMGGDFPVVEVKLKAGESMFTESGAMAWMTDNVSMDTNMRGGFMRGLGRMFSGESLFMVTYTCNSGDATIAFGSSFPGEIRAIDLKAGESIICQKESFLAATSDVEISVFFRKRVAVGLFGGEGFIMQRITGPGTVFVEIDGETVERELKPGEVMKVDTGYLAMCDETVTMDVESLKGFRNIFFGGEGLFLTTLKGPGRIWLQTLPITNLVGRIIPLLPHDNK